ncbi:MAG: hypothetical protein ABJC24_05435 [Chloroflexota bacterium]
MSERAGRLSRLLLLCYPRSWRRRYGDELLGLLVDTHLTPRSALDVAAAGIRQRLHAAGLSVSGGIAVTIGPAWRHPTAFALVAAVILLPTFVFVGASMLAYELDLGPVRALVEPTMEALANWRVIDLLLVAAPPLAAIAAVAPLVRVGIGRRTGTLEAVVTIRALALNLFVAFVALILAGMLIWHIVVESVLQAGA